jgi:chitin deacetylase
MDVVAQLGWTMEIIHNSTEGRLPRFWRPPTGDADNRVRAIAKEIFGLQTIMWNQDTEDWSISQGGTTPEIIASSLTKWIQGPKSPGLIILEHELTDTTVQLFMDAVPQAKAAGWKIASVSQLTEGKLNEKGNGAWQNVDDSGAVHIALVATGDNDDGDDGDSSSGGGSSGSPSGSPAGSPSGSRTGSGLGGSPTKSGSSSNPSQTPEGSALSLSLSASHVISLLILGAAALAL